MPIKYLQNQQKPMALCIKKIYCLPSEPKKNGCETCILRLSQRIEALRNIESSP